MNKKIKLIKLDDKIIAIIIWSLFFISMIPVLYCGLFDYANGDDLSGAAFVKQTVDQGGGFLDYIKAVFYSVRREYYVWEGCWSSVFVWFAFEPSIWGEKLYAITPFISYFCLGFCISYTFHFFLKKYFFFEKYPRWILNGLLLIFIFQYIPNIKNAVFFWTAIIKYILPLGLLSVILVLFDKCLNLIRYKYLIPITLISIYIGGAGYVTIVLLMEVYLLLFAYCIYRKKEKGVIIGLIVPFLFFLAGFIISALSPGNAGRASGRGLEYSFSITKVIATIGECIILAVREGVERFIEIRPLFLFVLLIIVTAICNEKLTDINISYIKGGLIVLLSFFIYSSTYAPQIYSGDGFSGNVPNTIYVCFLISVTVNSIIIGYFLRVFYIKYTGLSDKEEIVQRIKSVIFIFSFIFTLVFLRFLIGNTSGYMCSNFIISGALHDYRIQMEERISILQTEEMDIVLPEMNNEQGPFMHMALTADPDNYTSIATSRFYGKNSVIAIPRDEWNEKYKEYYERLIQ